MVSLSNPERILMEKFVNGLLVAVEGIDGCGKTVFSQQLAQFLQQHGLATILTKEPGGTMFGLQLREILQYRDQIENLNNKAEYLLFAADRAQHFSSVVVPNLQAGKIVISDRTGDSSVAYQGYGRGLDVEMIQQINHWAQNGLRPNLIIYLKIDLETAQQRISKRAEKLTAFEQAGCDFMQRVINGFNTLYQNKTNVLILDGKLATQQLAMHASSHILNLIKK